jgi:hypothetical protein
VQTPRLAEAMLELRTFLFARVYGRGALRAETDKAQRVVAALFAQACA